MAPNALDISCLHVLWVYGVACAGLTDFPLFRFDGGDEQCQGVIQQRYENDWLPLCIAPFTSNLASVVCRELKCGPPIAYHPIHHHSLQTSTTALNVSCPLVESLRNCSFSPVTAADCDGVAFLVCTEELSLRLSGGGSSCAGRVELLKNGVWGAVCDDHWDALDAEVTCRQLGCGSALAAHGGSYFGNGPPQIHLDDVKCVGVESYLWECPSRRSHDCTEKEHAGVVCTAHHEVRLSGGLHNCSGRLEVYLDGVWATVCDSHWFEEDSAILCSDLGCGSFVKHTKYEHSLSTSVTFVCSNASSLWDCQMYPKNPHTCHQAKAVGIVCHGDIPNKMSTVTPSDPPDLTASPTVFPPTRSDSTHLYFIIVCALLLSLLFISVLVFTTIICRLRLKQKFSQQNPSLTRCNHYSARQATRQRPSQTTDDSLHIPILYTGPVPPSPHTRSKEPVPVSIPHLPPTASPIDDEEDYGFSNAPPKPLVTFHDSLQDEAPPDPPHPGTEYYNLEKSSFRSRGSSSTSSGEQNWYENYRYRDEDLMPTPQSYDGSSEYDDINSLASNKSRYE